jgi:hypothetical protein
MREFGGYDFVKHSVFRDEGDIQSTTEQKITKIDSVFINFHSNDKSKTICIQPFMLILNKQQKIQVLKPIQQVGLS